MEGEGSAALAADQQQSRHLNVQPNIVIPRKHSADLFLLKDTLQLSRKSPHDDSSAHADALIAFVGEVWGNNIMGNCSCPADLLSSVGTKLGQASLRGDINHACP